MLKRDTIKAALASSYAYTAWASLLALTVVPMILHRLGAEQYAIIGILSVVQGISALLDAGIASSLSREFARTDIREESGRAEAACLLSTFESVYYLLALVLGVLLFAAAPLLQRLWLGQSAIPAETVLADLRLIAGIVAVRMPLALYSAGYVGLQRQVIFNWLNILFVTLANVAGLWAIWRIQADAHTFLFVQLYAASAQLIVMGICLRMLLAAARVFEFRMKLIRQNLHYSLSVWSTTVLGILVSQADRVVLVRALPLRAFGIYSVASAVALNLYRLVNPITAAFLPRLNAAMAAADWTEVESLYRKASQTMSSVVGSAAAVVVGFGPGLIYCWVGVIPGGESLPMLCGLLSVGVLANAFANLPYTLQMAAGDLRIALVGNAVLALFLYPSLFVVAGHFGAVGGALWWALSQATYWLATSWFVHRRWNIRRHGQWLLQDIALPAGLAICCAALLGIWLPFAGSRTAVALQLLVAAGVTFLVGCLAAPDMRELARGLATTGLRVIKGEGMSR